MKPYPILAIYGSNGHGKEVAEVAIAMNEAEGCWDEILFINDFDQNMSPIGLRVLSFSQAIETYPPGKVMFSVGVGEPNNRMLLQNRIVSAGYDLGKVIHPCSSVAKTAVIGPGAVIGYCARVGSGCILGSNVCIQPFSNISHDCSLGDNVFVAAHASIGGRCTIGNGSFIGMGALLREKTAIGEQCVIGLGSNVVNDVEPCVVALGNPAHVVSKSTGIRVLR